MPSNLFMNCEGRKFISRRNFLKASAVLTFAGLPELTLGEQPSDKRLLTILLRGGLDGLYAVPPVGDKGLSGLRPHINPDHLLKLDGFFGLHPAFKTIGEMYAKNETLIVHATSLPYTGRSHFEGQNIMETGVMVPYAVTTGWMGRALDLQGYHAVSMSLPVPLILRGRREADNFYPTWLPAVPARLLDKVLPLWSVDTTFPDFPEKMEADLNHPQQPLDYVGARADIKSLAIEAAQRLRDDTGPRMAVLDYVGFDTHSNEPTENNRLMAQVDEAIAVFRGEIGDDVWKNTYIVTVTEFGRTAAENGSMGTDHGWGTAILLMGGALKKGGVVADWTGLKSKQLFEGRDLRATIDARELYGALMSSVLGVDPVKVRQSVFDHSPEGRFDAYI